ncbi:uncharacterized protein LOC144130464 [Amblyomma americanum]
MLSGSEAMPGAGEAAIPLKDALAAKALNEDGSSARVDGPLTFETRRLEGTLMDAVSGCTSSGFTTQTEVSELPSEGRTSGVLQRSSSRAVPEKKSCRSSLLLVGGDAGVGLPSPTKSLERRPVLFRSTAAESLRGSSERVRGGWDGPVAHDARTGFASSLKLLAENLVNETSQLDESPPRASSLVSSETPSAVAAEVLPPPPIEMALDVGSVTHIASETSVASPAELPDVPSTSAFTPPVPDSVFPYEVHMAQEEPPPEAVVVQPAPRAASQCSVQVLRVEIPEAPVRPEHFANPVSRDEAPMAGSTLPLNAEAPRLNRPAQMMHHHQRQHAIPPLAAPLCTRWCCAKISMISMAIMSLFAAFMIYAFREDTFVDLVNWAATWNTSSIRGKFMATQALSEAENVTESAILKQNVP